MTPPNRGGDAPPRLIGGAGHAQDVVPRSLLRSQLDCPRRLLRSHFKSLLSVIHARGGLAVVHPPGGLASFVLGVDSRRSSSGWTHQRSSSGPTRRSSLSGGLTTFHSQGRLNTVHRTGVQLRAPEGARGATEALVSCNALLCAPVGPPV